MIDTFLHDVTIHFAYIRIHCLYKYCNEDIQDQKEIFMDFEKTSFDHLKEENDDNIKNMIIMKNILKQKEK